MKFYVKDEPEKCRELYAQIDEAIKKHGWKRIFAKGSFEQNGENSVFEFNSRPAILLKRSKLAQNQLETLMTVMLIQGAAGATLEKTEI